MNENNIEEQTEKVMQIVDKVSLIIKRIIIGVFVLILTVLTLIDTLIVVQTIKAKDYIDVVATYVETKEESDSEVFKDCVYTFKDKNGKEQEIIVSVAEDDIPADQIKIKYDENNPQEYYEEGATMNKSGFIWYGVKIVAIILLIFLFFNKKLLSKINLNMSIGKN